MGKILLYFIKLNILIIILAIIGFLLPKYINYRKSKYGIESGNSFLKATFDRGNYGEFLTFRYLEKLEVYKKLLTNIYLPKEDGTTTEVDVVMITRTGIYVFESKNYSGWIFGKENQREWTQTLPNKFKNKFYNPIWQNKGHIFALKNILGKVDSGAFKSYIVFSERCELKDVTVDSQDVKILKRNDLVKIIEGDIKSSRVIFNIEEILEIYLNLKRYSNVDATTKKEHINNINTYRR